MEKVGLAPGQPAVGPVPTVFQAVEARLTPSPPPTSWAVIQQQLLLMG